MGKRAAAGAAFKVAGEATDQVSLDRSVIVLPTTFLEDAMLLKHFQAAFTMRLLLLALVLPLIACRGSQKAERPALRVFASPDEAGSTLVAAAASDDKNALLGIFGPDSKELLVSGDPVQDRNTRTAFVEGYGVMHRWRKMTDGGQVLLVGADNFPFPIPLKSNVDGKWFFDTAAGKQEVLNRRIGRNELAVIEVSGAVVDAEAEYFAHRHDGETAKEYAMKFISDPGKQNGLYWQVADGQPPSPLGPMVALATAEGYRANAEGPRAFHGYYFHLLKRQTNMASGGAKEYVVDGKMTGGFAFVAFPAQYGNSGVMTFMVNQDGMLLEKDMGTHTAGLATAMSDFDPNASWKPVT